SVTDKDDVRLYGAPAFGGCQTDMRDERPIGAEPVRFDAHRHGSATCSAADVERGELYTEQRRAGLASDLDGQPDPDRWQPRTPIPTVTGRGLAPRAPLVV